MRPEEYLRIVLRRWWLIPLLAIVAAVVAYAYTAGQPATYSTSATLSVTAEPLNQGNDIAAKNRLAPLKSIIASGEVATRAAARDELRPYNLDAGTIIGKLALAHSPDNNTIQIAATDSDPRRAAAIVNAVAAAFIAYNNEDNARLLQEFPNFTQDGTPIVLPNGSLAPITRLNITQLGSAGVPSQPSAPRPKLNAAAGAILGVGLALVLAFALEYLDDTLRTPSEVRRHLGLPTVARIPASESAVGSRQSAVGSEITRAGR
jgi:capsular polysaccharide biosynthesis protein